MVVQALSNLVTMVDGKLAQWICWRKLCVAFLVLFVLVNVVSLRCGIEQSFWTLATLRSGPVLERENFNVGVPVEEIYIEDVIAYYSGEALVLVRIPPSLICPPKEKLLCRFGDESRHAFTKPTTLHMIRDDRAAIMCAPPPGGLIWDVNSFHVIELGQAQASQHAGFEWSSAQRPLVQWAHRDPNRPPSIWTPTNLVVYESLSTDHDVVVLVHGASSPFDLLSDDEELARIANFRCIFNGEVETKVTSQALEVFRCRHPPATLIPSLLGTRITVQINGTDPAPSVAYYSPRRGKRVVSRKKGEHGGRVSEGEEHHRVCSCIMLNNRAKFLSEWMHYYKHLGVSKVFLYDNNSEDNLEETIAGLTSRGFNISKQGWPWVKTQNAAFSHCALLAGTECEWATFIDIDEYVFPNRKFLPPVNRVSTPLAKFIGDMKPKDESKRVGQLYISCNDFGPSGLTVSPPQGVTQGYTCRLKNSQRHKSIVKLDAIHDSLRSSIHHFRLRDEYQDLKVTQGVGVIYHYKYQVWDEFQIKFRRRASTYVVDWTLYSSNETSQDRADDLGDRAVKPPDWETRYCEVWDDMLKKYTRKTFGSFERGTFRLAWEKSNLH